MLCVNFQNDRAIKVDANDERIFTIFLFKMNNDLLALILYNDIEGKYMK